ncbi:MAG: BamA/TamA family outer membrane protein [Saprospiraceae bacterium]|nr:BamA/TamA family outer membrane protein [Saprospiraceae bacterium]
MLRVISYLCLLLVLSSCTVGKYIDDDIRLYGGASVELREPDYFINAGSVRADLLDISQPKKNRGFPLWIHYAFGNPERERGFGNFIKRQFGQEPVFYSDDEVERSKLGMRKFLYDQGYFNATVEYDSIHRDQRVHVRYVAGTTGRYRMRDVHFPRDSSAMARVVENLRQHTELRSDAYYSLERLVKERSRIGTEARNQGFYHFTDEDIFYFVDTNAVNRTDSLYADIWLRIRAPREGENYKQYRIGHSYIYPNYDLSLNSVEGLFDSTVYGDLRIFQNTQILKPKTLDESITQNYNDIYSEERQIATTNHLLDLDIYKFVNLNYRIREVGDTNYLDRYIYLTPGQVQTISAELEATTRANTLGMSIKGSYAHKNLFHGAERLDLSLSTGFENGGRIQVGDDTLRNNLVELTARVDLSIPRFVVPFVRIDQGSTFHIPRTKIGILANFQRRRSLFTSRNYKFTFGYDWEETREKRHQIDLFSFNIFNISQKSEPFQRLLDENTRLERSLSNLLILGSTYIYTYTNQELDKRKDYFFFLGQLEAAGNTSYLASRMFKGTSPEPYRMFGRQFSQFTKFDFDVRYHWVGRNSSLVTRFVPGIGIPYLNSTSLPYIKQYYLGGASSMRAFPIRSLLGSYTPDVENNVATISFEQTGEVKLEGNIEYRFDILSALYLKGAFFLDVGNTWLLDPQKLEADRAKVFNTNSFASELAFGAGAGVRVDIQYVVLRLDFGVPLKKPFLEVGERWTFGRMGNRGWFKDNLTLNIALGYPF